MIIAGKLSVSKERIDHSFGCFGGTKMELEMTTFQLSLSKLREEDSKRESNYSNKSTTTVIALSKGKAQLICAGNCRL
tara:strand:- start:36 stop:269 length:234 start_codon:yes stop_codon:yes gene_type:complete